MQHEESERKRLKRVIEDTLNDNSDDKAELKRLRGDKKELNHLKAIMTDQLGQMSCKVK